jgi:hypothetical protein
MNMQQSGHLRQLDRVDRRIAQSLALRPAKPVVDGEICYEDLPIGFRPANGRYGDWEVRVSAYRCAFSGGCGVTYGAAAIWQFFGARYPVNFSCIPSMDWKQAMHLPGARHVVHLRQLMEQFSDRALYPCGAIADVSDCDSAASSTLRDGTPGVADAKCMLTYLPTVPNHCPFDLTQMASNEISATLFDPRTGKTEPAGVYKRENRMLFKALPDHGRDWVVIFEAM